MNTTANTMTKPIQAIMTATPKSSTLTSLGFLVSTPMFEPVIMVLKETLRLSVISRGDRTPPVPPLTWSILAVLMIDMRVTIAIFLAHGHIDPLPPVFLLQGIVRPRLQHLFMGLILTFFRLVKDLQNHILLGQQKEVLQSQRRRSTKSS